MAGSPRSPSTRTLVAVAAALLAMLLVAVLLGVLAVRSPQMEPVTVPRVSAA